MTHLEIQAFFEIIKAGSLSAAAQNLYITQPALSRRIKSLEAELGYSLFDRKKGQRNAELTEKGTAFISVAHKWLDVWREARELTQLDSLHILNLSSVGSVSSYILPQVFSRCLNSSEDQPGISFHNYHSFEAYQYVGNGLIDLALISDDMYYKNVETIPAFREEMVLAANKSNALPSRVHPDSLDPSREIRLPWNPEYDMWHDFWFGPASRFRMLLDQMNLLEYALSWQDTWAVVPLSVAHSLRKLSYISVSHLESPPPERIIYYLKSGQQKSSLIKAFLRALDQELGNIPGVISYLGVEETK